MLEGITISCILPLVIDDVLPEVRWVHMLATVYVLVRFMFVQCWVKVFQDILKINC
jgi:hypothetical protein